jgi:hypothetical protein
LIERISRKNIKLVSGKREENTEKQKEKYEGKAKRDRGSKRDDLIVRIEGIRFERV